MVEKINASISKQKLISIIIPLYNEESTLPVLFDTLIQAMKFIKYPYEIIFVNDGSSDLSAEILDQFYQTHKQNVRVLTFSRNFGHQLALTAGLDYCHGEAAIVMDADLQDPPHVLGQFVQKWEEGYDIVYGLRKERRGETFFKKAKTTSPP